MILWVHFFLMGGVERAKSEQVPYASSPDKELGSTSTEDSTSQFVVIIYLQLMVETMQNILLLFAMMGS